ncbi:MAG: ABC transporter permease, partial [Anaerolineales bacterium]|nr:ABC transporter permease [Anaerolineales bacterium]
PARLGNADLTIKLALTMVMSWLYLLTFYLLAQFFTLRWPNSNQALLLTVIIWLVFAFIFPQIGDTMDLDNQLPGGFFATLGMDKAGEEQALQQFKWYETVRDGVEELSPTKHYERISFALLGVKKEFLANTWQEVMQLKLVNLVGLLVPIVMLLSASYIAFLRQEISFQIGPIFEIGPISKSTTRKNKLCSRKTLPFYSLLCSRHCSWQPAAAPLQQQQPTAPAAPLPMAQIAMVTAFPMPPNQSSAQTQTTPTPMATAKTIWPTQIRCWRIIQFRKVERP